MDDTCTIVEIVPDESKLIYIYAPNFEEVEGAYWFRLVRAHSSFRHAFCCIPCMLGL